MAVESARVWAASGEAARASRATVTESRMWGSLGEGFVPDGLGGGPVSGAFLPRLPRDRLTEGPDGLAQGAGLLASHRDHLHPGEGAHRGGAAGVLEHGHLADVLAGAEPGEHLRAGGAPPGDLDP